MVYLGEGTNNLKNMFLANVFTIVDFLKNHKFMSIKSIESCVLLCSIRMCLRNQNWMDVKNHSLNQSFYNPHRNALGARGSNEKNEWPGWHS